MRLVRLTRPNAECVWVNAAQVIAVEPYPLYETPEGKSRVELVGQGAKVYFAVAGRFWGGEESGENEPYRLTVTESPGQIAGLFLEPCV